ncbi:MAG: lactoylglutathione lyase [Treponemataceae bacterium]|nr:MAG: lactoylglutathione lyase [Treponemataceae bacterium]
MNTISAIAHIAITVKDMDKSLDFYTRVLGFKKAFEIPEPKTGEPWIQYLYIGNGQFAELFYGGAKDNPWSDELRGFNHICLQVEDIHAAVERVKKEGIEITDGPKQGADFNWQAWIKDPDGIRVELMQIDKKSPHYKAIQELQ